MLRNFLMVALRNLKRQKIYAFINISGLSLGLACSLLIFLWVADEFAVDTYHENYGRIYQVMEDQRYSNGQTLTTESTPGPLAPALMEEFSEVEYASRTTWGGDQRLYKSDDEYFTVRALQVDSTFFNIFSLEFLEGSQETAFNQIESIVLTDETAKRIFGDEPALGKTLEYSDRSPAIVTGVVRSRNLESSLRFDALQTYASWERTNQWGTYWGNNGMRTFVLLHAGVDGKAFSDKIKGFIKEKNEGSVVDLFLHAYADRYLRSDFREGNRGGGRIEYVRIFGVIAVFILVIACINFMNLATARSARRSKEIGVRKAVGANRGLLIGQFMAESMMISFVAMGIALLLTQLALPYFNTLTDKGMEIQYADPITWVAIIFIAVLTGLVAGSYPALFMASFDTVKILKGSFRTGRSAVTMRHALVVFQFVLSITLIVSTVFMYRQMRFMIDKNLGLQKEQVVYFNNTPKLTEQYEAFRNELVTIPGVEEVSRSNQNPVSVGNSTGDVRWDGMSPDDAGLFQIIQADYDFTETMKINVMDGRSFDRSFGSDTASVLINQEAARKMAMQNPVGQTLRFWNSEFTVVGLMADFHTSSLRSGLEPLILMYRPAQTWMTIMRVAPGNMPETMEQIQAAYKKFETRVPLEYRFLDEYYESLYRRETTVSTLARWFAGFAIVISCLGLLGLASFTAEQRTKEIGVRKVLGASVTNLVLLLTGSFTRLVALAFLLSVPITWYLMDRWLASFAFRISIDPVTFMATGVATLLIAWLTVLYQCLKSAYVNPAKVLKYE